MKKIEKFPVFDRSNPTAFIYVLGSKLSPRYYVGSTTQMDWNIRIKQHYTEIEKDGKDLYFYNQMRKELEGARKLIPTLEIKDILPVIEVVKSGYSVLSAMEQYYINLYDSLISGFNTRYAK